MYTILHRNLRTLLSHTSNLRSHYESRFFHNLERNSDEHLPTIVSNSFNRRDHGAGPGRPRVHVTREQLQSLHEDAGFTWSEISRTLGISERTLSRRRHELGMRVEGEEFSSLSDSELDDIIRKTYFRNDFSSLMYDLIRYISCGSWNVIAVPDEVATCGWIVFQFALKHDKSFFFVDLIFHLRTSQW